MSKSKRRQKTPGSKNNLLIIVGVVAVVVIAGLAFILPGLSAGASTYPATITVAQAVAKRDAGAFILDVRTQEEWDEFHVPDSTLIPLDELESRVSEVPTGQEIVVICRSGNRSQQGRDILRKAGFEEVSSMSGGLKDWKAQGLPTVEGP